MMKTGRSTVLSSSQDGRGAVDGASVPTSGGSGTTKKARPSLTSILYMMFEVLSVTISIVDVASDLMMVHEFYTRQAYRLFYVSAGTLLIANVIYAVFGTRTLPLFIASLEGKVHPGMSQLIYKVLPPVSMNKKQLIRFSPWRSFLILLPFAQLVPLMHYATLSLNPSKPRRKSWELFTLSTPPDPTADSETISSGVSSLQHGFESSVVRALALETQTVRSLSEGLDQHFEKHRMLYVETVIESIPQTVIQLLAMSVLNEVSTVQIVSLSLSIFSIASKAYVVGQGFNVKLIAFRTLVVTFDIFAFFYTCSSLISATEPQECAPPFAGESFLVSHWSCRWFIKEIAFLALIATLLLLTLGIFVAILRRDLLQSLLNLQRTPLTQILKGVGVVTIVVCAVAILVVPLLLLVELCKLTLLLVLPFVLLENSLKQSVVATLWAFINSAESDDEANRRIRSVLERLEKVPEGLPSAAARRRVLQESPFRPHRLAGLVFQQTMKNKRSKRFWLWLPPFLTLLILNALAGAAYPLVHGVAYYNTLNGLQLCCLYGTFASLAGLAFLSLSVASSYRYSLMLLGLGSGLTETVLAQVMRDSLTPRPQEVLLAALSGRFGHLLPNDVVRVVGSLMRIGDFVVDDKAPLTMDGLLELRSFADA